MSVLSYFQQIISINKYFRMILRVYRRFQLNILQQAQAVILELVKDLSMLKDTK